MKMFHDLLKLSIGFERLFFFLLMFLILVHIVTCLWILLAELFKLDDYEISNDEDPYENTWMYKYSQEEHLNDLELYFTSFYWCITTITTIGYGDISGTTTLERVFCSIVMIIGVVSFSFLNGALASILSNFDVQNAALQEKVTLLNKIYKDYFLPLDLYI
jgi:hypothetical protein